MENLDVIEAEVIENEETQTPVESEVVPLPEYVNIIQYLDARLRATYVEHVVEVFYKEDMIALAYNNIKEVSADGVNDGIVYDILITAILELWVDIAPKFAAIKEEMNKNGGENAERADIKYTDMALQLNTLCNGVISQEDAIAVVEEIVENFFPVYCQYIRITGKYTPKY